MGSWTFLPSTTPCGKIFLLRTFCGAVIISLQDLVKRDQIKRHLTEIRKKQNIGDCSIKHLVKARVSFNSFSSNLFLVSRRFHCDAVCLSTSSLKTPSATDTMPTLTSTSTTFTDIVPFSDGVFFFHSFGGLHPSCRFSSQWAKNSSNDKVRSEFSSAKRELPLLSIKVAAVGVFELELDLAAVPVELITRDSSSQAAA